MPPGWKVAPPKTDDEYFERMTRTLFAAGLNWKMIENKLPGFRKAFSGFGLQKVAKISEKGVSALLLDGGIIRNERKIKATIFNAQQILEIQKEFNTFSGYLESFKGNERKLQNDLQERFHHLGPSSTRMFLWLSGYPLTPNKEEKAWIAGKR